MKEDQSPQPAETPEPLFYRPTWKQGSKRRQDRANAAEAVAAMAMCDRAFIGFADIADACAKMRDNGSDDEVRRDDFIKRLVTSFRNKEFEYEGRSVVVARANLGLYDDPTMSYDDFRKSLKAAGDDALAMRMLCGDLEIPRRDALAWFQKHGNPLPVNWFPEAFDPERKRAELLAAADGSSPPEKSGAPGRPSSMHLITPEFERRIEAEQVEGSVSAESEALANWLRVEHPNAPTAGPKAIANKLRSRFNQVKPKISA